MPKNARITSSQRLPLGKGSSDRRITMGTLGKKIPAKRYVASATGCTSGTSLTINELSEKKKEEATAIKSPRCGKP